MTVTLIALEWDALDPVRLAGFWSQILGRTLDPSGTRLPAPTAADFAIRFVPAANPKTGLHRMHPDLTSASDEDQRRTVDLALSSGATHLDVGQRGDEGHVVLADPEGNEFCVIEADNRFLVDTARIGALAGDGTAEVGHFWSRALGWPLVWDQDGETAVQSPYGGTKLTWGGTPVRPKTGRNRLRWVLATAQLGDGLEHLRTAGAELLSQAGRSAELVDPGGNEFLLETAAPAPRRPVPFEVFREGAYLHGTKAALSVGDVLVPGRESNFEQGRLMNYVYFTRTLDAATWGAELAVGQGPGRIYVVEPLGSFEDDPNVTDKKFPGNPTQSFRSREPLRVVGEIDWVGHTPEQLRAMRDGLAELQRRGEAQILD